MVGLFLEVISWNLGRNCCLSFSSTGLAGLTRGGAMGLGMAMATDGTTTGATWDIMATLASTGDQGVFQIDGLVL